MLFITSGEASQEAEPEDAIPEMAEPAERRTLPLRSKSSVSLSPILVNF